MKRSYITFGADHSHEVNGTVFNKDTVCLIEADDPRAVAFEVFGRSWSMEYPEAYFDRTSLDRHFPRGVIDLKY